MSKNQDLTVTLTLDNDETLECAVLNIFEAGDHEYIASLPIDEDGNNEDGDVFLYRFTDNGEGVDPTLENIESDDEYEIVADKFDEWLDTLEYEEYEDLDAE